MQVIFDPDDLRPLVAEIIAELQQTFGDPDAPLTYSEPEAARLLNVPRHVLRDCRLRGEIRPRKIGKAYRYTRRQLIAFAEGEQNGESMG